MKYGYVVLSAVLLATVSAVGCGDDDGGNTKDAGATGTGGGAAPDSGKPDSSVGAGGTGGTDLTTVPVVPLECGTTTCDPIDPMLAAMGVSACCRPDDSCGIKTILTGEECLQLGAPGGLDLSCAGLTTPISWPGCCTPEGQCGALASGTLGCIPNSSLMMVAPQACTYDPNNTCRAIRQIHCDGPEDCPGQQCCGHYNQGGGYNDFSCADDCAAEEADPNSTAIAVREICHPGQECTANPDPAADPATPAWECRQNTMLLPDYLFRCSDTGEAPVKTDLNTAAGKINCGDVVCGSGEKCCVSVPGLTKCVPEDEVCTCTPGCPENDGGLCGADAGI
jgi:hypothetical protein